MKFPNAYFGTGPGNGDEDPHAQREIDALNRNRVQMTVATSTFAGIALVGMFCSCLWFACCRNSSSKTRKKTRTWASAEAGLQNNPYSYEGYMETQGYLQMSSNTDGGVAPYVNNPLYHPTSLQTEDNGLTSAFDFSEQMNKNPGGKAQLSTLFGGPMESCPKDVPPSYTALFFATSDPSTGLGKGINPNGAAESTKNSAVVDPRVTSIQPIHLKVTSTSQKHNLKQESQGKPIEKKGLGLNEEDEDDFIDRNDDPSAAPPVSLMSVESDPGKAAAEQGAESTMDKPYNNGTMLTSHEENGRHDNPPPYNPGYKGYMRF